MMARKVGIVSYALEGFRESVRMSSDELVFTVASAALRKAGAGRDDIDAVAISTIDAYDGITISNGLTAPAAGGYGKDATRIQGGGIAAIFSAYASIRSGSAELAVVAGGDAVRYDDAVISNASYDVHMNREIGITNVQSYALVAASLLHDGVATEEDFARVAAKNYADGKSNRHAHVRAGHTREDVLASPMVSWPLRALEVAPVSKGACALVLASEERARRLSGSPTWITGIAAASNAYFGSWRDLVEMKALRKAVGKACAAAAVEDPAREIDVFELYTPATPLELAYCGLLGLRGNGKAPARKAAGTKGAKREPAVNPSGGALCANPGNCGGLYRVACALESLARNDRWTRALVEDSDLNLGFMGDTYHVMILEKETR